MKKVTFKIGKQLLLFTATMLVLIGSQSYYAQPAIRYLHVTDLVSPFNEIGAEYENEFNNLLNTNYFSWPRQYSLDQNTRRMQGLWIGCKNFEDPIEGKLKSVKVIGSGPRNASDRVNQIFEKEIKLIGKYRHPQVFVDDQPATINETYDRVDSIDENMIADRMILIKFNTSIGISVTKKVMVFATPNHGNYYINDYVFKNTGVYNRNGDVKKQTLQDVYFYWVYRMAFAGESVGSGSGSTWGAYASSWGNNTINHDFGDYRPEPGYQDLRGFYSYYGPSKDRTAVSYAEDWGCPNESDDGRLGSWQFDGAATLHADKSSKDPSDDNTQPKTTWFIGSDINALLANVSQYDEVFMGDRYTIMSEGHPDKPHDQYLNDDYPINYTDARRQAGGGTSQGQGFGPYTMEYGDSVHIVFAEGVSGLSREKNLEVGAKWLQWYRRTGQPTLTLPNGSTTNDHNLYKRRWIETGSDSILKTLRNAKNNFSVGYQIPQPPQPPNRFIVTSGGDRISLSWSDNAVTSPNFDGYTIYRSEGNVMTPLSKYDKIFECNKSNVVHSFDDKSAIRGFDYYYYIQSKDNGSQNDVEPGKPLYSSLFWTITSQAATLQRPAVTSTLDSVRVVPNPYDIRSRLFQFGDQSQYDRIAVYGLPPVCKLKVFTERGDLIWENDHTRGTGDELWDSTTSFGQIVSSGIYILYVEAPDGRKVIRKFVIIR